MIKQEWKVTIRKFEFSDVPQKVKWINDSRVNRYLHYTLPLEIEKTEAWFFANKDRTDRYDAVIECDNIPVGLIGLLQIDFSKWCAEYYIAIGEPNFFGRGIAAKASTELFKYAFGTLKLNSVYLYTECDNISAIHLYEKFGFKKAIIRKDYYSDGSDAILMIKDMKGEVR